MSSTLDRSSGNGKSATAEPVDLSPARIMQLGFRAVRYEHLGGPFSMVVEAK